MFCSRCGKENAPKGNFCVACGNELRLVINNFDEKTDTPSNIKTVNTEQREGNNTVLCLGMMKHGRIMSSSGAAAIEGITIKSYWKNIPVKKSGSIYFDYDPSTKQAFNVRGALFSSGISENHRIEIKGGNFKEGRYFIVGDGAGLISEDKKLIGLYNAKISIISIDRAQQKIQSLAIGAVGTVATLGVGAILGAMHASKKYNTIEVETESGEFFIAQCRPQAYQTLYTSIKENSNGVSNKEFEDTHNHNPNYENIENFFKEAKGKEVIYNGLSFGFIGIILLVVLANCGGN